jgi:hypothetical protein
MKSKSKGTLKKVVSEDDDTAAEDALKAD